MKRKAKSKSDKLLRRALEYVDGFIYDLDNDKLEWQPDDGKKAARWKAVRLSNQIREALK